ncbi:hypothetical protein C2845_PM07G05250 [Panicum miliaceum]|uniref:Uncharacterized protein n=1 Tax=Panicum miliaceum TaxID=4540 RepID=A0A3L6SSC6_PANMI|nr:hypothetical protein C2845_PM07G05250 [Panicum miliaceum]
MPYQFTIPSSRPAAVFPAPPASLLGAAAPPSLPHAGRRPVLRLPLLPLFPAPAAGLLCARRSSLSAPLTPNRAKDEQNQAIWTPCGDMPADNEAIVVTSLISRSIGIVSHRYS